MKKAVIAWLLVLTLELIGVCGCGKEGKPLINPEKQESESAKKAAEKLNEFSLEMGRRLYQEYEGENFVCSPISLWLPLAALLNASDGTAQDEMLKSLGLEGLAVEEVNEAASRILYSLIEKKGGSALQIANLVYVDEKYNVNPDFEEVFLDYYRGRCMALNFSDPKAVDTINEYISEKTGGEIEKMLSCLDADMAACIINTVYFQDEWAKRFRQEDTKTEIFYTEEGELQAEYMRHFSEHLDYYENERLQAVWLEFKKGEKLLILLPKNETAGELYGTIDRNEIQEIAEESNTENVTLWLPKFSIETETMDLMGLLQDMNVPYIDVQRSDITGLVNEDLYISKAEQKVVFKIDEEKVTAAAATGIELATKGSPTESAYMICNKPFVFFLIGETYDGGEQILFSGVVNKP